MTLYKAAWRYPEFIGPSTPLAAKSDDHRASSLFRYQQTGVHVMPGQAADSNKPQQNLKA